MIINKTNIYLIFIFYHEIDICESFTSHMKKENLFFRIWFYFRTGWSTYFSFIFAAVNTLVVTYYLAIEKVPQLEIIFPNFIQYVLIISVIGIPLLGFVGYSHYKKTQAFRSETDIALEVNPYHARQIVNSELTLQFEKLILELLLKIQTSNNLEQQDKITINNFLKEYEEFVKIRTLQNKKDSEYFKNLENLKHISSDFSDKHD